MIIYNTWQNVARILTDINKKFQFPLKVTLCVSLDIHGVFLYTDLMITLARQVQLKLKKFDEVMIKLKTKHLDKPDIYADLHKLNERIDEIQKLVDNSN